MLLCLGVYLDTTTWPSNPSLWAAIIVTPLMDRIQDSSHASDIIFIDTTSSCDVTETSITPILAPTPAGALPIAICLHNSQKTEGYTMCFNLLKKYKLTCFGGKTVRIIEKHVLRKCP